jgi:protein TonB
LTAGRIKMALRKNPKYDLKARYNRVLGICMILSISILISAFKFFPAMESDFIIKKERKVFTPTVPPPPSKRLEPPPPPPKPPILVEAPDTDFDMDPVILPNTDEFVKVTGPPPPSPEDDEEPIFEFRPVAEVMPEPIGGIAAIHSKIEYPPFAKRAGIQGKVFVKAYVDENGIVQKVELLKGIGAGCDEEAMNAVKNTRFSPGKQRGKPVRVQVTVPIKFVLK